MDRFDRAILRALQRDGSLTNARLAETVNLSPSQCSRRRAALESAGLIAGYHARLDGRALGFGLRAIIRVNLSRHGQARDSAFAAFVARHPLIRSAHSVSGDADYVFEVQARDLDAFAEFVHGELLPQEEVAQVRSEIVLRTLKDDAGVPLD